MMPIERCRRILVVGSSGAGKSTFAVALGRRLELPVIHLDQHYWNEGWSPTPDSVWDEYVETLWSEPQWVMDGTYVRSLPKRLTVADAAVFLDLPSAVCRYRVIRRILVSFGRTRADLAPGCPEKLDFEFLRWVWSWPRDVRPDVVRAIDGAPSGFPLTVLRSTSDVRRFLRNLGPPSFSRNPLPHDPEIPRSRRC